MFEKVVKLFDELKGFIQFIVMVNKFLWFEKQCTIARVIIIAFL